MRRWPRWFSSQFLRLALVLVVAVVIAACTTRIETIREIEVTRVVEVGAAATPLPPAEPRLLTVLVGAGADTVAVNAFLPSSVTIRAGDTIMWELNQPEEFHTTVFLSGAKTPPVFVPVPGGATRTAGQPDISLSHQWSYQAGGSLRRHRLLHLGHHVQFPGRASGSTLQL